MLSETRNGMAIEDLVPEHILSRHLPRQRPGRDFLQSGTSGRTALCLCAFSVSLPEDSIIRGRQITWMAKSPRISFTSLPWQIGPPHLPRLRDVNGNRLITSNTGLSTIRSGTVNKVAHLFYYCRKSQGDSYRFSARTVGPLSDLSACHTSFFKHLDDDHHYWLIHLVHRLAPVRSELPIGISIAIGFNCY